MKTSEIVRTLREAADLLEVADANTFEVAAWRKAADSLDQWTGDLAKSVAEGRTTSIPSVGKSIATVIDELVKNGSSAEVERIHKLVPEGLPELLKIRGLGPKRVRKLWQELRVEDLLQLKTAAEDGRVAGLKGFGAKTVERMIQGIEYLSMPRPAKLHRTADQIAAPSAAAGSGKILAGMSGYSYPDWKGVFYPPDAKTRELLEHYSLRFLTVEINNSFYRFPTERVLDQWAEQTPERFQFAFKAHSRITHKKRLMPEVSQTIIDFVERCGHLEAKLGCVLFQLPPDFQRDDDRLEFLMKHLPVGPRYAVEFRHESWFDETVFNRLRKENISIVSGDTGRLSGDQSVREVTADFVYVRMRRTTYSDQELASWQEWFDEQSVANRDVLAYFKHDELGYTAKEIASRWPLSTGTRLLAPSAKQRAVRKEKAS